MFVCPVCRDELNGKSVRSYIDDKLKSHEPSSHSLPDQVQQLSTLVESLSQKVDSIAAAQNQSTRPLSVRNPSSWPRLGANRGQKQVITAKTDRGTNAIDLSGLSVASLTPTPAPPKFWLYLSGFQPLVTTDDVRKIVARCLNVTNSCDVVRLVPRGMDIKNMSFISFKIGLDPSLKQQSLLATTWPSGLLFREFIDEPKNRKKSNADEESDLDADPESPTV